MGRVVLANSDLERQGAIEALKEKSEDQKREWTLIIWGLRIGGGLALCAGLYTLSRPPRA